MWIWCMCVCLWAYVLHSVPRGSCFQMTPSSELSPDICISLPHTRTNTRVCPLTRVHASVVASFLLGWDSVTSIWGLAVSHTHWQSLTLTTGDGQTDVSVCECLLLMLMTRDRAGSLQCRRNRSPWPLINRHMLAKCDAIGMICHIWLQKVCWRSLHCVRGSEY